MTIKELAAQTGYSVGTVSRVLNNHPNVSEKTRRAVLAAAEACSFQLNANAKQLKQQRSNTILVVVKGSSNELFGNLLEAIQAKISRTAYPLVVDYVDEDANAVERAVQLCREKKPLGIIFLGGNRQNFLSDFVQIELPSVLVTNSGLDLPFENLSSVTSDDRKACEAAIDHLVELGHRRIAIIGGGMGSDIARLRYEGCLLAFDRHHIPFDAQRDYVAVRFSYADGYRAVKTLLARGRQFTAVFAISDVMAIGAVRALQDSGLRVPEDVSVIGFDGLNSGEYTVPRLATLCQRVDELAGRCADILIDQIEHGVAPRHETIPCTAAWKESVGPLDPAKTAGGQD